MRLEVRCDHAQDFKRGEWFLEIINSSQLHRLQVARDIVMSTGYDDGKGTVPGYRMLQNYAALKPRPALAGDDAVETRGFQQVRRFLEIHTSPDLKTTVVQHTAIMVEVLQVFVHQQNSGPVKQLVRSGYFILRRDSLHVQPLSG